MRLTPLDIKKQEFKKSMRGYDAIEVETFLEMVAEEFEALIREKNALHDEALKLKTQLRDYQSVEKTLQDTLMTAQQSIAESRQNSERQADLIVREAEMKADKIVEDAKLRLAALKNELVMIKSQKDSFARRLRHLLSSQLDLIEVLESDDMGYEKYEKKKVEAPQTAQDHPEKIEFESIEDMLNKRTTATKPGTPSKTGEAALPKHWEHSNSKSPEEEQAKDLQEKRSRISDQLIF